MNKCRLFLLTLAMLLWSFAAGAEIYTWVDAQGVRHYSDNARHDAKRANLPGIQSVEGNPQAMEQLRARAQANRSDDSATDSRLPRLQRPESQETFRDAQGIVPVSLTIGGSTELRDGEQITYYLDGSPIPQSPTNETQLQLGNVQRGAHTLSAALLFRGREIRRTAPVTFYMKPPSAISPLNRQNAEGGSAGERPPGATVAPPAGNAAGVPAAPRFNTTPAGGERPPS